MFWFFIAGFIAGVVGTLMLGRHFAKKHMTDTTNK